MYLADYLGMIGLPILPVGNYPDDAKVAFLPVQAAADATLFAKMQRHMARGATLVLTPALARALGPKAAQLAGVEIEPASRAESARTARIRGEPLALDPPLEVDGALKSTDAETLVAVEVNGQAVPFLTRQRVGRGQLLLLNVRTFSESDFRATGEWLLAPKQLGLPRIPQPLADTLRGSLLAPLGLDFRAPAGVELVLVGKAACVYSFRDDAACVQLGKTTHVLPAHQWLWLK
jgi:sulfur carrier protein ThiS